MGIIHILGWTTCVAVYFGVSQWVLATGESSLGDTLPLDLFVLVLLGMSGIVDGTCVAGLVLFAVRRCRGIAFPICPGETLLLVASVNKALVWIVWSTVLFVPLPSSCSPLMGLTVAAWTVSLAPPVLWLWATFRTHVLRWRLYFLARTLFILVFFADLAEMCEIIPPSVNLAIVIGTAIAPPICLVFSVVKDLLIHKRYPWTHWTGVALAGAQLVTLSLTSDTRTLWDLLPLLSDFFG